MSLVRAAATVGSLTLASRVLGYVRDAMIAAVLTFIPNVGPILAAVPAMLLALADSPMKVLYVVALYTGIQTVESYLVTPLIQRRTVSIPPALTLSAQILAGVIFGIVGVALATPLAVAALVLVHELYVRDVLEGGAPEPSAS